MSNEIQFLLYSMPDDEGKVQVVVKDETLWCTQKAMAQLFGVGVPAVSKHLKNIFEEGELDKEVVVSKMEITTQHGAMVDKSQTHIVDFYQRSRTQDDTINDPINDTINDTINTRLASRKINIIEVMKKSPSIKGDDIAKSLEISVPTLRRDIAWLRENGYISREGSRKNGVWVVLKNK
jgi:predicted transcriptional regulator